MSMQNAGFFGSAACGKQFDRLYGRTGAIREAQPVRHQRLAQRFAELFPKSEGMRIFSAPGRAEIGGNHTDHQSGRVLAASVNLDTVAAVAPNGGTTVRIESEGYKSIEIDLSDLAAREEERGSTAAMVRGCASRMLEMGHAVQGFDAAVTSAVLGGSGLSSSAAFEVLVCRIFDGLFGAGTMRPSEYAKISQYAENNYFGKPSGLLDQMGSAVGGLVAMDFEKPEPLVEPITFDFAEKGYAMAVVNTGGSHGDLTPAYAAIPEEMRAVAACFGEERLRFVDPDIFDAEIPGLHGKVSDRAILRAMHFFSENARVAEQVTALKAGDLPGFLSLVVESGESSERLLQNIYCAPEKQPLTLALALSRKLLGGRGAWRVHGGGFAGTILAFLPLELLKPYARRMDAVFGDGACQPLGVRPVGAYELICS